MPSETVYLSFGTNLGDRLLNLQRALAAMPPGVNVRAESPVYETSPWGVTAQPAFLNMVIRGRTHLAPLELLHFLKHLELELGRVPSYRYGPRLIDIDILFYARRVLDLPGLSIPHPRLSERAFVLVPLHDLAPRLRHPLLGSTVTALLKALDRSGVKPYAPIT